MKEDPCYTGHFLSDGPDKFGICFLMCSEAASKKMYPLRLLESKPVYLLVLKLVNPYSGKHSDCNNLAGLLVTCGISRINIPKTMKPIMPNSQTWFLSLRASFTFTALL